ncbi:MFS transporter [Streptomyces sp. NBC_00704]|uniref:MFS transporter n=1 Tax=Streptomyces sp. NBC_00704 TaxID=2975809 RepID=UPI002E31AE73|nr:MFS transporter [Streptomyces sp. NBC_00704]
MNRSLTLASSVAGAVIVALDGTVLTVARPALQHDLHASLTEAQWTGTGYLVAVAGLLVFAGRLGDRHGHRRVFAVGMLGFGAVSAALAVAPGVGWVIALRIVQGVFGALLQPATLGMLRASFPPDRLRTPIAVRTAAIGVAAAVGPVVGGALTTGFGWRAVFLVNVVPALLFGALALASREETRPSADAPLDLPGALLLAVTLACLVHTLVTLPGVTWSAPVALLAAVAFVRHERRAPAPLLPSAAALGRTGAGDGGPRPVGAALALLVLASAALNGAVFACVYLLQDGLGLTPLHSALLSLPLAVALVAAAPAAAVLLRRAGARATLTGATAVLAAGLVVLAAASAPAVFCAGFTLVGAGFGATMVAATHVVVKEAPAESAGVAGGMQQTAMNVGPALGVAAATVLMDLGAPRSPLWALACAAAAAPALCGALPGRARPAASARPAARPADCPAGHPAEGSDATHSDHGAQRGPHARYLRDDEVGGRPGG